MPAHKAVSVNRLLLNKFPRESRVARQPLADDAHKFGIGEVGDRIWFVERLRRSGRRGVDMHFDGGSFEIHLPERGGMADCAPFARKGDRRPVHERHLVADEEQALKCYIVANAGAAVEKPHVPPLRARVVFIWSLSYTARRQERNQEGRAPRHWHRCPRRDQDRQERRLWAAPFISTRTRSHRARNA